MEGAIVLANGLYETPYAKTAHGLVRGTSRYRIVGVIDATCAGRDAGALLDGRERGIPVFASVDEAMASASERPRWCVVGVATHGGVLPDEIRAELISAVENGLGLVSGLHHFLSEDPEIAPAARASGVMIVDVRKPKPRSELRFWTGESRALRTPRVAVLGTDCALGKRTTSRFLLEALRDDGLRTEMIYTGQTGWLQGGEYGTVLDSLPNDFVSGELEHAVVSCCNEKQPELVLIEGQSALRNPSGPCGAELILSAGAKGVVLQHAPARRFYDGLEELEIEIGDVADEIDLIRRYGARVLAVTINSENLERDDALRIRDELAARLDLPVVCPLVEGVEGLVPVLRRFAAEVAR